MFNRSNHAGNRLEQVQISDGGSAAFFGISGLANLAFEGTTRINLSSVVLTNSGGAGVIVESQTNILTCEAISFAMVDPEVGGATEIWDAACP